MNVTEETLLNIFSVYGNVIDAVIKKTVNIGVSFVFHFFPPNFSLKFNIAHLVGQNQWIRVRSLFGHSCGSDLSDECGERPEGRHH
jgi:hypothetical protein